MSGLVRKPSNARSARAAKQRQPKLVENPKCALVMRGPRTSNLINQVLTDLYLIKKPRAIHWRKKNQTRPFETDADLSFFSEKNDCSLLAYGSHNKKRPHNLVLGRFFDHQVLELVEFGVTNFRRIGDFEKHLPAGIKPCLIFCGDKFEHNQEYKKIKNLLLDFFSGGSTGMVNLRGLEAVMTFTVIQEQIHMRTYYIHLKKSGMRLPRVELEEIGPAMDLTLRRTQWPPVDLWKQACKQPRHLKRKKTKNVTANVLGQMGRVHKEKQHYDSLQTRKMKGLKNKSAGSETREMGNKRQKKKPRTQL